MHYIFIITLKTKLMLVDLDIIHKTYVLFFRTFNELKSIA